MFSSQIVTTIASISLGLLTMLGLFKITTHFELNIFAAAIMVSGYTDITYWRIVRYTNEQRQKMDNKRNRRSTKTN